jgi:Fungal protein kinase
MVNFSNSPDRNSTAIPHLIKPDVSIYHTYSRPNVLTDSSLVEIFIEFKCQSRDDPFCDMAPASKAAVKAKRTKGGKFLSDDNPEPATKKTKTEKTKGGDDSLGQITLYAAAQLGSQFCTHLYSVFMTVGKARILRWDRSGAIVTDSIDINRAPHLVKFFHRYSKAPPEMRGIDKSVSDPTPEEAIAARQALGLAENVLLFKLEVPCNGAPNYFLTPSPQATFYTPPGRATRGFQAYDISWATPVFLKDTWRIDTESIQAEGLTYETLDKAHVPNIPRCVAFGDISTITYHATKTSDYTSAEWTCIPKDHRFVQHRHYRLVLDVIGRSLMAFESSYEMMAAVRDAIIGRFNHPIANEQH